MAAYGLAHLRPATVNEEVLEYIEAIQETMDPYGGRFLVHGAEVEVEVEVVEGSWPGTVVVVEFRDLAALRAWYASPAYQRVLPLRTRNVAGDVIIVEGVGPAYDARMTAAKLRQASNAAG